MEATRNVKEEALRIIEDLPEDASWDDLMYRIYVCQTLDAGWEDSEAGRPLELKAVRAKFGLALFRS